MPEPIRHTNQEWFNAAWERAKIPRKAQRISMAGKAGRLCVYSRVSAYTPGCFIGVSLPAEVCAEYDGKGSVLELHQRGVIEGEIYFLQRLQSIHDSTLVENWDKELRVLAIKWNLTIPGE